MYRKRIKAIQKIEHTLKTKEGPISFLLGRSAGRKTIAILVDEKGQVKVYCPSFVYEKEIFAFVRDKATWIFKKIKEAKQNDDYLHNRRFVDGIELLFLGKKSRLVLNEADIKNVRLDFDGNRFIFDVPKKLIEPERQKEMKIKLMRWYRDQAQEILGGRIFHYSRIVGIEPKKIAIRTQKRTWGNCHYNSKTINLNWQIVLSPLEVIDYIVVHELCHLKVPNHSKGFWKNVENILPDYKNQKKWLKANFLDMVFV